MMSSYMVGENTTKKRNIQLLTLRTVNMLSTPSKNVRELAVVLAVAWVRHVPN